MGDTYCWRHAISHDARRSCPECVLDEERRDRKRLIDLQEESRRDAQRRHDEDREEREAAERQRDPEYLARQSARFERESNEREQTRTDARRINHILGAIFRCRFLADQAALEVEREKRLQQDKTAGFLSKFFARPQPDKSSIRAIPGTLVMEFGNVYRYQFGSAMELFVAYGVFVAQIYSSSDAATELATFQKRVSVDDSAARDAAMRITQKLEHEYKRLEEPLKAKAYSAVAAYEKSRDSCKERNPTCPGWKLSGFEWDVSESLGWRWTGTHELSVCGDRYVFKTPYEYLAVFQARQARSLAKGEADEWGAKEVVAFQKDHRHWLGSHLIDRYAPVRIR
jgi:hypothetical protein